MNEFIWHDGYRIGDDTIDGQHQNLFMLAGKLVEASGNDPNLLENLMLLYKHGREHFQFEEQFLKQYRYPDYQRHVDAHDLMLGKLVNFSVANRIHKNEWHRQDMLELMQEWVGHILGEDCEVRNYFFNQSGQETLSSS